MGVKDTNVLDAVGINEETGIIELLIKDELDWNEEGNHLEILEEKLASYLKFILEGQIFEIFNNPEDFSRNVLIIIEFSYDLPSNVVEFLKYYEYSLASNKVKLVWDIIKKN